MDVELLYFWRRSESHTETHSFGKRQNVIYGKQFNSQTKILLYIEALSPVFDSDGWTSEAREIVGRHFNYLKKYTEEGTLILAGRTLNEPMPEDDFGIAILETESKEVAQMIMDNDPAVSGKVMYAKLYEFSLALIRK